MGRSLALLVVAPFIAAVAQAQTGRIAGAVTDLIANPLAGTNLIVVGTTVSGATGSDGRYTLANVPVGRRLVRATRVGYAPDSQFVAVTTDQTATISNPLMTTTAIAA